MPLIIDEPEDNLDSEFIFHSLVPVLRTAKERRQVIIVTHNPISPSWGMQNS
jgi:DNA repair exonuclease SbcCD ATPase subunit